VPSEFVN